MAESESSMLFPTATSPTASQASDPFSSAGVVGWAPANAEIEQVRLEPGARLGPYRVLRRIGAGGFGQVYEAVEVNVDKRVAIKVLRPNGQPSQLAVQRFLNEARSVNLIGHSGLVDAHAAGTLEDGIPYIVMEFLDGQSLGERLRDGPMAASTLLPIARQLARALAAAHRKGVIHRDLKPKNVMLVPDSEVPGRQHVKIIDFGIAKLTERQGCSAVIDTCTGAVFGSLQYMSPEQCQDASKVDAQTDVYALGVILYESLTGRHPFACAQPAELRRMHQELPVPSLSALAPALPRRLCHLVDSMLDKVPAKRPTMVQVAEQIESLESAPQLRQRQVLKLVAVAVGLLLLVGSLQKWRDADAKHRLPAVPEGAPTLVVSDLRVATPPRRAATGLPAPESGSVAAPSGTPPAAVLPARTPKLRRPKNVQDEWIAGWLRDHAP